MFRLTEAASGTKLITIPLFAFAILVLAVIVLAVLLWSVKRRRRPRLELASEGGIKEMLPSIVGITQGTLVRGNKVKLLENGAYFDSLYRDLEKAKKTIDFETFLAKQGVVTKEVSRHLIDRSRDGVEVRLLLDNNGGRRYGKPELKKMKAAGCRIAKYHPWRFSNLGLMNNRDHRKITIIDGRIGYVGGHCLVDDWLGDAEDKKHFRDLSVRVEGPIVAQLQSAFSENWIEETGDVPAGPDFFRDAGEGDSKDGVAAHAVFVSPAGSPSAVKMLHYLAIHAAKKKITIQNPYFLPDPDAREALRDARERGVEVRVMLPSADASDFPVVQHASHHHYGSLLEAGVKIYEYEKTLLHQKVFTVDGCWSAIGSTNFDDRSFEVNDEISLGIYDDDFARQLEEMFEKDLKHCHEVSLDEWKKRSPWHKLLDLTTFLFNEQL